MDDKYPQFASSVAQEELMKRFGIKHAMADVFYYREYRYGRIDDAIAQAMRDLRSSED